MADSKLRTAAANIADRAIESERGFVRLETDPDNVLHAYNDIVSADTTKTVNGVVYTIDKDVTDYYYTLTGDTFTTTTNGQPSSDYKQVEVTVSWVSTVGFRDDEGSTVSAADLGTGSITLTSVIPAIISSASGRISDESTDGGAAPPISYTPGQNPDVVSLNLGGNKFKESLLPSPDVIRRDELVETRFDVITYSQTGGPDSALFLRREEFSAVSCECELNGSNANNLARRPVIWAGDEYIGGDFVEKAYGTSANNQQSSTCESCCRDHHDGGSNNNSNLYGPFKANAEYTSSNKSNDHKHYEQDGVSIAGNGDTYVEACRLVRVDGFFRVMQDFRREDQHIFPADFLTGPTDVATYSNYVTGAATSYYDAINGSYPGSPPCIGGPSPCVAEPSYQQPSPATLVPGDFPTWTSLPFGSDPTQQLRSRGVYIDYISSDLRSALICLDPDGNAGDADSCQFGDVVFDKTGSTNFLEILPFFDVQLTFLNRWNESPTNTPVDTTNEALADGNTHSRGIISKDADGGSDVEATSHRGNLGFTDTPAIDPVYDSYVVPTEFNVQAGSGGTPPPDTDPVYAGSLTESVPGNPSITITGTGSASCGQTGATWTCTVPVGAITAAIVVSDYGKKFNDRWACVSGWGGTNVTTNGKAATTTFDLIVPDAGASYTINIQDSACT